MFNNKKSDPNLREFKALRKKQRSMSMSKSWKKYLPYALPNIIIFVVFAYFLNQWVGSGLMPMSEVLEIKRGVLMHDGIEVDYNEIYSTYGLGFYMVEPLTEKEIERQFESIVDFSVMVITKNRTLKPIDQVDHVGYRNEYVLKEGEVVYRRKEYTERKNYYENQIFSAFYEDESANTDLKDFIAVVDGRASVKYHMVGSYVIDKTIRGRAPTLEDKEALVRLWKTRYMIYKVLESEFDQPAHPNFIIEDEE